MSDYITADNLEIIIEQNDKIKAEISRRLVILFEQLNMRECVKSEEKLAFKILKQYGLIQIPIENKHWGGAIYFVGGKCIPVINTALPRVNQFFTAWHEVYHLIYDNDKYKSVYEVSTEFVTAERKADYFAAKALMGNIYNYYIELKKADFLDKIAQCMDLYQVPYKAILIQLYEEAKAAGNNELLGEIRRYFDLKDEKWCERFRKLGLDEELVSPSYVVNLGYLEEKINECKEDEPEVSVHELNLQYLERLKRQIINTKEKEQWRNKN